MTPQPSANRLKRIRDIGERLSRKAWVDIDLFLKVSDLQLPMPLRIDDKYAYSVVHLQSATEDQLTALDTLLTSANSDEAQQPSRLYRLIQQVLRGPVNVLVYLAVGVQLVLLRTPWAFRIPMVIFLVWDLAFVINMPTRAEVNPPRFILERTLQTMTLVSYYVPIVGVLLYALLVAAKEQQQVIVGAFRAANISSVEVACAVVLATVGLLLVPIYISDSRGSVSIAMKGMLFVVMFAHQGAAILFAYFLLVLARTLLP